MAQRPLFQILGDLSPVHPVIYAHALRQKNEATKFLAKLFIYLFIYLNIASSHNKVNIRATRATTSQTTQVTDGNEKLHFYTAPKIPLL